MRSIQRTSEERLSQSLRDYARRKEISLERAADDLHLSRSSVYNRAGRQPIAAMARLRKQVEVTGDSADWLLGFEVPRKRDDRAEIGVISDEIRKLLEVRCPPHAYEPAIELADQSHLAEFLVDTWWTARLRHHAGEAARAFRELSNEIELEARRINVRRAYDEARNLEIQIMTQVAKLESLAVSWDLLALLRSPLRARSWSMDLDVPSFQTDFPVTNGSAFLWHGERYDTAVYLEPDTASGSSFGTVRTRHGNSRKPRFLEILPLGA